MSRPLIRLHTEVHPTLEPGPGACPVCGSQASISVPTARVYGCGAATGGEQWQPCPRPIAEPVLAELRERCRVGGHHRAAALLRRRLTDRRRLAGGMMGDPATLTAMMTTLLAASSGSSRTVLEQVSAELDEARWV
jgi:hypothetical protein